MNTGIDATREKVRWRARRGLLELDIFFTRFIENHLAALSEPELDQLLDMLTCDDHELWAMLNGTQACEVEEWKPVVALLKQSAPDVQATIAGR